MMVAWLASLGVVLVLAATRTLRGGRLGWSVGAALVFPWLAPGLGALVACTALA
jgi:hypothetical protein